MTSFGRVNAVKMHNHITPLSPRKVVTAEADRNENASPPHNKGFFH